MIRSKKGILAIGSLVALFLVFAGVAFVQSKEAGADAATASAVNADASCPTGKGAMTEGASAMPGSCSELHAQALAAGKMTQPRFEAATVMLASATSEGAGMTAEQCRDAMAKLGYECNETDLKACAVRLQALGFCKDMTADECAAKLAKGLCTSSDPATCNQAEASGACCATVAKSGNAGSVEVQPAVVTQSAASGSPKQCDWTKGNCGPAAGNGSGD